VRKSELTREKQRLLWEGKSRKISVVPGITQDLFHFVMVNDILIGSVAKRNICGTERKGEKRGCPKSRIAPFAIVYFGKKNYLTVAKKQTL